MKKKLVLCALVLCALVTLLALPAMAEEECAHEWKYIGKAYENPTCTEKGEEWDEFECTKCGVHKKDNMKEVNALDHKWDEGVETTAATCEKDGVKTFTCSRCGDTKTEAIPAYWHDKMVVCGDELPPCQGGKQVWTCERCHNHSITVDIPASASHKFGEWVETKAATCTAEGTKERTCTVCNKAKETLPIAKLAHMYAPNLETGVAASCTKEGYLANTCTLCGDTYWSTQPKLPHDWDGKVDVTVKPVCGTNGAEYDVCSVCGARHVIKELESEGAHEIQQVVLVAPTCEKDGVAQDVCSLCFRNIGAEYPIAKLNHTYTSVVVKPTCTEKGYTEYTCTREGCGFVTKADYVDKEPHDYDITEVVKATCTEKGYTVLTCKDCEFSCKVDYTEPNGHTDIEMEPIPATCTTSGWTRGHKCKVCGEVTRGTEIPALGHTLEAAVTVAPTCTKKGSVTTRCSVCGEIVVSEILPAEGHMFSKDRICIKCGYNVKTDKMPYVSNPVTKNAVVNAEGKVVKYTATNKNGVQNVTVTNATKAVYTLKLNEETLRALKNGGTKEIVFVVGDVTLSIPVEALKGIDLGKGEIHFQVNGNKFTAQTLKNGVIADQTEAMITAGVVVK